MARTANHLAVSGDKAQTYEIHASKWLADANEASECGKYEKAEKCWQKAQYWLDKANKARGWS